MLKKVSWLSVLLVGLSVSCKNSPCAKSTGSDQTEIRNLQPFTKLNLSDKIQVELKPSSHNRATITCGQHLLRYIITETDGNELTIRNDNKCNFLRSYKREIKLVLEYTDLTYISSDAAGKVYSTDTLKQPYLEINTEGSSGDFDLIVKMDSIRIILQTGNSNLRLHGHAGRAYFYSGGTSLADTRDMRADYCFCNNSGSGDFYVSATNYLFADAEQEGWIYYSGNPAGKDIVQRGKGKIEQQ